MYTENSVPRFVTVKQLASMGILSEYCIRRMLKEGKLPAIYSGKKALINFETFCSQLNSLSVSM